MKRILIRLQYIFIALLIVSMSFLSGCNDAEDESAKELETLIEEADTDSKIVEINGKLFSVPSPIQTAMLIKKTGAKYNSEILHEPKMSTNYVAFHQKATNLGVYGCDLVYIVLYQQNQRSISTITAVKSLADELGVSQVFNAEWTEQFQTNADNPKELLKIISNAFSKGDHYFKRNDQSKLSTLILLGGWVEGLYLATEAAMTNGDEELYARIGEQKAVVQNILKLLEPHKEEEIIVLANELKKIQQIYDNVNSVYKYIPPTIDVNKKLTTINSESSTTLRKDQLKAIRDKISEIRDIITL